MQFSKFTRGFAAAFAVVAMMGLAGCGEEGAGEKAGKKLDKAAEEMKKKLGN